VVVPASLRLVWAEEIERWLPHVRPGMHLMTSPLPAIVLMLLAGAQSAISFERCCTCLLYMHFTNAQQMLTSVVAIQPHPFECFQAFEV
jgi:hypothetical protein